MTADRLSCEEAFRRLDDYLDRELSPGELEEVRSHLDRCAVCTSEFALESEVLEGIRAKLRRLAVPEELRARVARRLREAAQ